METKQSSGALSTDDVALLLLVFGLGIGHLATMAWFFWHRTGF
jgi:hypothetical protein